MVRRPLGLLKRDILIFGSVWQIIAPVLVVAFPPFDGIWDVATVLTYVGVSIGFTAVLYAFWQAMQAEV
jgi:hypothetical protein